MGQGRREQQAQQAQERRQEQGLYFGCGGCLGAVIGIAAALGSEAESYWELIAIVLGFALVLGILSAWQGDRFWDGLKHINRWGWGP